MSVRKRKDGRWIVDVKVRRGHEMLRVRRAARTREAGLRLERQIRAEFDAGRRPDQRAPTLAEWSKDLLDVYAKTNNKPSELERKEGALRLHLLPALGGVRLDRIGVADVERYKAQRLAAKAAPKTINNELAVLRRALRVAHEWGLVGAPPPIKALRAPSKAVSFWTFEESDRLLDATAPAWRPFLLVAIRTGLRLGELLGLRWEDVDLAKRRLVVRQAIVRGEVTTPKSHRTREVPLAPSVVAALRELPSRFRGGLVFCHPGGAPLARGQTKWPLWNACRDAGLTRSGWHRARHTFASHLVMKGVPIRVVQQLLGHSTVAMTERYAHLAPEIAREAVDILDAPTHPAGARLGHDRAAEQATL